MIFDNKLLRPSSDPIQPNDFDMPVKKHFFGALKISARTGPIVYNTKSQTLYSFHPDCGEVPLNLEKFHNALIHRFLYGFWHFPGRSKHFQNRYSLHYGEFDIEPVSHDIFEYDMYLGSPSGVRSVVAGSYHGGIV